MHAVLDSPEAATPGTASTTELFSGLWSGGEAGQCGRHRGGRVDGAGLAVFGEFLAETTGADADVVRRRVAEQVSALFSS